MACTRSSGVKKYAVVGESGKKNLRRILDQHSHANIGRSYVPEQHGDYEGNYSGYDH